MQMLTSIFEALKPHKVKTDWQDWAAYVNLNDNNNNNDDGDNDETDDRDDDSIGVDEDDKYGNDVKAYVDNCSRNTSQPTNQHSVKRVGWSTEYSFCIRWKRDCCMLRGELWRAGELLQDIFK